MLTDISQFIDRNGANSPEPPESCRIELISYQTHTILKNVDKARFRYESDPQIYDSGKLLTVVYRRNEGEPAALENRLLDHEDQAGGPYKENVIQQALWKVFPDPALFYPTVTRITLEMVNGVFTSSVSEAVEEIIPYLPIPPYLLHIPTVPIAELRRVDSLQGSDVDRVKWKGQTFAFKNTIWEGLEGTLKELAILDGLRDSPSIIDLEAIVVNKDNTVRGFLMPFMYAGEIGKVLKKVREDLGVSEDDDKLVLDWSIKHTWARQITQGVVDLHSIQAYNGDLKTENILIGPEGQAILIDFLPAGISDDFAAPEVLAKWDDSESTLADVLTGPADVFSLGVILHMVVQEDTRRVHIPSWSEGPGSAPSWYRNVVERCLQHDPSARPTAAEVLSILHESGRTSIQQLDAVTFPE